MKRITFNNKKVKLASQDFTINGLCGQCVFSIKNTMSIWSTSMGKRASCPVDNYGILRCISTSGAYCWIYDEGINKIEII